MKDAVRCFAAIELAPGELADLLAATEALKAADPDWSGEKWVAACNLHITLKFMGDVAGGQLAALAERLGEAVGAVPAFEIKLAGVKAVPSARRCSMVWAAFDDSADGACASLAATIDDVAAEFEVEPDARAFKPHVTLARARRPRRLAHEALTCANAKLGASHRSMSVPSVTFFASTLTRRGPIYERIGCWNLSSAR